MSLSPKTPLAHTKCLAHTLSLLDLFVMVRKSEATQFAVSTLGTVRAAGG
jgi:hypothetical protein